MAFRLVPPQSTDQQLRSLAEARIDSALRHLDKYESSRDAAHVHTVRRRCKQVRALARLIRPALGDDYAPFNSAMRDAARALAPLRSAHVAEELRQSFEPAPDEAVVGPGAGLKQTGSKQTGSKQRATSGAGDPIELARAELQRARALVEPWSFHESDVYGFALMAPGMERTYRRGRRGVGQIRNEPTDEALHEWRKDVKDLWYQLRLVQPIAPSVLDPMIDQLDRLGKLLGDHHDIGLLLAGLAHEREHVKKQRRKDKSTNSESNAALVDIRQATDRATDAQNRLRAEALRSGTTIYAEKPAAFGSRVGAYWRSTARWGPEPGPSTR